jgi:hypothetical protein
MTAKPPTHDELTAAMKAMVTTTTLDAAIEAAEDATEGMPYLGNVSNHDRTYARAMIAKLLEGMELENDERRDPDWTYGYNAALTEMRRRAGIEGDK